MKKRFIASMLVVSMVAMSMVGCSSKGSDKPAGSASPEVSGTEAPNTEASTTPLVIGSSAFSEKFSPFFSNSVPDSQAQVLTNISLATFDRVGALVENAKDGQVVPYNGVDYTYNGLSNVKITQDKAANTTTYNIQIRDDVKFSDGELLTTDDIIFTMYVISDATYDGPLSFSSKPIIGMKNYKANSTAADSVTPEEVAKAIADMPKELADAVIAKVITPILTEELDWCASLYGNEKYKEQTEQYPETKDLFASFYSIDESYDSTTVADEQQVLADVVAMYGSDYKSLANGYAGDEAYFDGDVTELAETYVIEAKKAAGEGEEVPNIEGIKKISDTELEIVTTGYDASMVYQLDMAVAPLHYYGSDDLYDYEKNQFGFPRGDLSSVRAKTTTPMGAGPYKFIKFENKVIYYEANEHYFLGAPKTAKLQFKEVSEADKVSGLLQGTIDLTDPSGSKTVFQQIRGENSNGELEGDKLVVNAVDNLGYGYIGMNATNVSVAGDPASEASKNLRKAIATIFSVYRDVSIDTYYGDAASIIQYPISNTSWAAPQKSDAGYEQAFAKDAEGNAIYTDGMSAEDKYTAAKQAALSFLQAAGYTVADGKVTAAPEGAKLQYEVLIGADGSGDHPSFSILTDAKQALSEIGMTLNIKDFSDTSQLWTTLDGGQQEIWVAAWQATPDPDMYQIYHSDNIPGNGGGLDNRYGINDKELDEFIFTARQSDDTSYRKTIYKECLDIVMDWAVEIPVYQRQNCIIFSPERIDETTITPDITSYYEWYKEVENIVTK